MTPRGPIVLTSDFGTADGFVGAMKGVILGINPAARIVDLTHDVAPQDVRSAAFVLWTTYRYFPPDSIFAVVVDPGVGSRRRALAVETPRGVLVGPDNGVLSWALGESDPASLRAVELADRRYWLPSTSATFHGRDVFAPVAAHLSLGVPIEALGPEAPSLVQLGRPRPSSTAGCVEGEVLHVDRFGNLITNLRPADLEPLGEPVVEIAGATLRGLRPYFSADVGLGAVVGSAGLVEIAYTNGSAAAALGAAAGAKVRATRQEGEGE